MTPKVFITGSTGYIGGDALFHLTSQHPDFTYALLVRSEEKAQAVSSEYPKARIVLGSLDDTDIIRREAAWADIVIRKCLHTYPSAPADSDKRYNVDTADSSDNEPSAKAIAEGLREGHSASRPGFWLHVGGTGILTYFDSEVKKSFGELDDKVFDDYDGVEELVNLPAAAFHRNIDEIVLQSGTAYQDTVKTAIICPPTIYGQGRGPVSGRGRQVYELASFILKEKYIPRIGKGLSRWNHVHIHDLSALIGLLVDTARDSTRNNDPEVWGAHGYFLSENGEHTWGDLAVQVGQEVYKQGLLQNEPEVRSLPIDEAVKSSAGFEAASWGMNSRARAFRARKVLGWQPKQQGLVEEIPIIVRSEQARLRQL